MILIVSLEVSLILNLVANIIIIITSFGYLIFKYLSPRKLLLLFLISLLVALIIFVTIYYFTPGHSFYHISVLFTRIYAYVFLGATFIEIISILLLARLLEQNFKLPGKFAYRTLAALNVLPKIHVEVNHIRLVGNMRHYHLSFYSSILYFKVILAAISWSSSFVEGVTSYGCHEDRPWDVTMPIAPTKKDWLIFSSILTLLQLVLFFIE